MSSINRTNVSEHLLEYQLNMIGKSMVNLIDDDHWFFNWTMTQEQFLQFRKYAIPLLQKVFHFNRSKAELTFEYYWSQFKLRIKN